MKRQFDFYSVMNSNTYSISITDVLHNGPEEIGFLLLRLIQVQKTLLTFVLDKSHQLLLLHLSTVTDDVTAGLYGLLHTHTLTI